MTPQALIEYTGTLVKDAQVRSRIIDHDGQAVPVLCVELEIDNPQRTHLHAEQRFEAANHHQAELAAKRLTKGARITLHGQLADMRLFSGNTTHIHQPMEAACQK